MKSITKINLDKNLSKQRSLDEIRSLIDGIQSLYDPDIILREAEKEINNNKNWKKSTLSESSLYKALTLTEFKNGFLLISIIPEQYKTFGVNMLRQLQQDYNCTLISEKAIAELATISFIRILELQRRQNDLLDGKPLSRIDMEFTAVLGKEIDRANRQFLFALQTLRMMKQPPMQFNIKTDTAIIGQNHVVQENKHE